MPELGDISDETDLLTTGAIPVGTMLPYAGQSAPTGWTLCNGVEVTRSSPLGVWLGGRFGNGNGSTTYNTPDMRDRYPIGKAESGTAATLGEAGGAYNHSHAVGSYSAASHTHGAGSYYMPDHAHGHSFDTGSHAHSVFLQTWPVTRQTDSPGGAVDTGVTNNADPGVGGGITGSGNVTITGTSSSGSGSMAGTSASSVGMPYQTVNYIIKN